MERTRKDYNLDSVLADLDRPLLVVNGSEDVIIPASQARMMYERAPGPKELKIYDGIGHCVYYEKPKVLPEIAVWMKEELKD